LKAVEV